VGLALTPPLPILGYGVHTSLEKPKSVAIAPLAPRHLLQVGEPAQHSGSQFWGELAYLWGFLPPKLGGRGGQCRVERLSNLEMYVHRNPILGKGPGVRAIWGICQCLIFNLIMPTYLDEFSCHKSQCRHAGHHHLKQTGPVGDRPTINR
jgi:hypothetical protein